MKEAIDFIADVFLKFGTYIILFGLLKRTSIMVTPIQAFALFLGSFTFISIEKYKRN